jgi:hypothetical protein
MRIVALAILTLAIGCGGPDEVDVSEFRRAGAPPAYWLGRSFDGLPLTDAHTGPGGEPTFVYGTCTPSSDTGCAPPLELQHWPLSRRDPRKFEIAPGEPTPCRLVGDGRITAAQFVTTGGTELYLGDRVVVVFASDERLPAVLRELRALSAQEPALPHPPAWVNEVLERCER